MKRAFFFIPLLLLIGSISYAQNRNITSTATPCELYLTGSWYGVYDSNWGPPYYETLRSAIYRITENGKKLTKQYDADYFANPEITMQPNVILADATSGVVYNRDNYSKDSYAHTALWVSFDYGKNWIFREENIGYVGYCGRIFEHIFYKVDNRDMFKSENFGENFEYSFTFPPPYSIGGFGYKECEFYGFGSNPSYHLQYTNDCADTFTIFPIDEQFVFGQICGIFPDVYRGGLPGEVYISSLFPDGSYKVSFSTDTGHTFRHVYMANYADCTKDGFPVFMSDREPGVFYIVKSYQIEDKNPWGWHTKICIEYYRDYGETLEATFCHDIHKNYEYEEVLCENITHLAANVTQNSVQLQWTTSADKESIRGYHVYRDNERITKELLTEPSYIDKVLHSGNYEYYVKTYYKEGCVSDSSNHVRESVTVGIKEKGEGRKEIVLYPNPTTGELKVTSYELQVTSIEVFDIYGRKVLEPSLTVLRSYDLTILQPGIYFVKILTDNGVVVKKLVKQ